MFFLLQFTSINHFLFEFYSHILFFSSLSFSNHTLLFFGRLSFQILAVLILCSLLPNSLASVSFGASETYRKRKASWEIFHNFELFHSIRSFFNLLHSPPDGSNVINSPPYFLVVSLFRPHPAGSFYLFFALFALKSFWNHFFSPHFSSLSMCWVFGIFIFYPLGVLWY